jgi:hypothetical protein
MARLTWEVIMRAYASLRRTRLWAGLALGCALCLLTRRAMQVVHEGPADMTERMGVLLGALGA